MRSSGSGAPAMAAISSDRRSRSFAGRYFSWPMRLCNAALFCWTVERTLERRAGLKREKDQHETTSHPRE